MTESEEEDDLEECVDCADCGESTADLEDHRCKPSGYYPCDCCGETIVGEFLCVSCVKAGCEGDSEHACSVPQCFECCDGDGPRASYYPDHDGGPIWGSNCDEPCPNAGKTWKA